MSLPTLDQWQTQTLRISFFTSGVWALTDLYEKVTGSKPEMQANKPQAGQSIEIGTVAKNQVEIRKSLNRLDMQLTPASIDVATGIPSVGGLNTALESFDSLSSELFKCIGSTEVVRLAIGIVCLVTVDDVKAGNRLMQEHLPSLTIDVDSATDIMVHLNFPIESSIVPGLHLNRIIKRSCLSIEFVDLKAGQSSPKLLRDVAAFQLETDFNTVQEWSNSFSSEQLHKLFNELKDLSVGFILSGKN